jgi:hypothetical protein
VALRLRNNGRHRIAVVRGRCNEELLLGRHGKGTKVTGTIHRILERPRKRNQLEIRSRGVLLRCRCNLRRIHMVAPDESLQELATQDLRLLVAHGILERHVADSETHKLVRIARILSRDVHEQPRGVVLERAEVDGLRDADIIVGHRLLLAFADDDRLVHNATVSRRDICQLRSRELCLLRNELCLIQVDRRRRRSHVNACRKVDADLELRVKAANLGTHRREDGSLHRQVLTRRSRRHTLRLDRLVSPRVDDLVDLVESLSRAEARDLMELLVGLHCLNQVRPDLRLNAREPLRGRQRRRRTLRSVCDVKGEIEPRQNSQLLRNLKLNPGLRALPSLRQGGCTVDLHILRRGRLLLADLMRRLRDGLLLSLGSSDDRKGGHGLS